MCGGAVCQKQCGGAVCSGVDGPSSVGAILRLQRFNLHKWALSAQSLHIVQNVCNSLPVNVTVCAKIAKITQIVLHKLHKWCAHCTECRRHYPMPPEASADPAEDNSKYSSLIAPQYNAPRTHLSNILAIRGLLMDDL